jgi:hypothetical protein
MALDASYRESRRDVCDKYDFCEWPPGNQAILAFTVFVY